MRKDRINKTICKFMVIILLLSGMCFYMKETHSMLVYSFSESHERMGGTKKNNSGQHQYLPEEMEERLNQSISEVFEEKEENSFWGNFRFLGFLRMMPQKQLNRLATAEEYPYDPGAENAVVVRYIHYSDGKKEHCASSDFKKFL